MNGLVMVVHVDEGHDGRGEVVDVVGVVENAAHRPRDTRAMRAIHCLHTCTMSMQSCGARVRTVHQPGHASAARCCTHTHLRCVVRVLACMRLVSG